MSRGIEWRIYDGVVSADCLMNMGTMGSVLSPMRVPGNPEARLMWSQCRPLGCYLTQCSDGVRFIM
jgi:hypothetical protein